MVLPSLQIYSSSDFTTGAIRCHMYLCNTKKPWQTKIIYVFTNIVQIQNLPRLQTDNHKNWCLLVIFRGNRRLILHQNAKEDAAAAAALPGQKTLKLLNSRSYVINSESPSVNINTYQRSRVETLPTFSHGQREDNSSSSTAIPTSRVSKRHYSCRTEVLHCTAQNNFFYTKKNPNKPKCKAAYEDEKQNSINLSSLCFTTLMERFPC